MAMPHIALVTPGCSVPAHMQRSALQPRGLTPTPALRSNAKPSAALVRPTRAVPAHAPRHPALVTPQEAEPKVQRVRLNEGKLQKACAFIADPNNLQMLAFGDHTVWPHTRRYTATARLISSLFGHFPTLTPQPRPVRFVWEAWTSAFQRYVGLIAGRFRPRLPPTHPPPPWSQSHRLLRPRASHSSSSVMARR